MYGEEVKVWINVGIFLFNFLNITERFFIYFCIGILLEYVIGQRKMLNIKYNYWNKRYQIILRGVI